MRSEEFLTKLAKRYVKEAGEKYKLENDELAQSPTSGMDARIKAARRRQTWQKHSLTFMGVAASIIVIIIAGIAFLPNMLREYAPSADMDSLPWATATPAPASEPMAPPAAPTPAVGAITPAPTVPSYDMADNVAVGRHAYGEVAEPAPQTEVEMFAVSDIDITMDDIRPNQAITNFSQNMFRQVLATGEENAVISALSAYYVLAMVSQGAAGQTRQEFDQLLGFYSFEPREMLNLTQNLTRNHQDTILNIAGSVWIRDDKTINTAFNQTMEAYFGAPANSRNFFAPGTIPEINHWVYDNTEGLIDSIVEEFDPDDVMLLINALYFKGQWPETMHYVHNIFTTAQGEVIEMDFLSTQGSAFRVAITPQYEAAFLPYTCNRFGFLLVRPTDGTDIRDFAAMHSFADVFAGLSHAQSVIQMPGLDLEYEIELNDILQNMGLTSAFNFVTADFSELIYTTDALKISEVLQKVRMVVDLYGTEAAAVTSVALQVLTGYRPPPVYLTFNTPYMYAIICTATNVPLFMGVVDNPA